MINADNKLIPYSKISYPPKDFVWKSGSDVQALWRKYGWVPPSESMTPPPPELIPEIKPWKYIEIKGKK